MQPGPQGSVDESGARTESALENFFLEYPSLLEAAIGFAAVNLIEWRVFGNSNFGYETWWDDRLACHRFGQPWLEAVDGHCL